MDLRYKCCKIFCVIVSPIAREAVAAGLGALHTLSTPAMDHTSKMNTQKRKDWVWHRINQIPHQVFRYWFQLIIFASKGNDLHLKLLSVILAT